MGPSPLIELRKYYQRYLGLGVRPELPLIERRRIELTNRLCFWMPLFGVVAAGVYFAMGLPRYAWSLVLVGLLSSAIAFVNALDRQTLTRVLLIAYCNVATLMYAWLLGQGKLVSPLYVAWAILPFALFGLKERAKVTLGAAITVSCWLLSSLVDPVRAHDRPDLHHYQLLVESLIFLVAAGIASIQIAFTCASLDLSNRKVNLFRQLFDDSSESVLLVERSTGLIRDTNEHTMRTLGLAQGELFGTAVSGLAANANARLLLETQTINRGVKPFEMLYQHPDGREIPFEVTTHGEQDDFMGITMRDLSAQRVLQTAQKLAAIGEMAGGIAHEINTPLATIVLSAETIRKELSSEAPDLEFSDRLLGNVLKVADRISKIVRAMKSLAKDGAMDPFEEAPLLGIFEDVFSLCHDRIISEDVELRTDLNVRGDFMVECRATEVAQVIVNLLNNAIDAVSQREERWIHVETRIEEAYAIISITDSGNGIPERLRDKVFQPFFTTKEAGKGTGIGLHLSRTIVDSHGGTLSIDPASPNTRFRIHLPIRHRLGAEAMPKAS